MDSVVNDEALLKRLSTVMGGVGVAARG